MQLHLCGTLILWRKLRYCMSIHTSLIRTRSLWLQPPLPAARRKGLLLRFAQAAALRLQDVMDPEARNPG